MKTWEMKCEKSCKESGRELLDVFPVRARSELCVMMTLRNTHTAKHKIEIIMVEEYDNERLVYQESLPVVWWGAWNPDSADLETCRTLAEGVARGISWGLVS